MDQKWLSPKLLYLSIILLLLPAYGFRCIAQDITTVEKKVILIFKFADYVKWPNEEKLDTFEIGIFSDDETLINSLKIFETITVKNKVISLTRFYDVNEIKGIQMLVLSNDKNYLADNIAGHIKNRQVLLITDRYKKQQQFMINFIYTNDKKLDFEVNKANILKEGMSIQPELLLLGGTEVDIAALYKESQKTLTEIQKQVFELEHKYTEQQRELSQRDILLHRKDQEIIDKTENINNQNLAIRKQKKELNTLTKKITEQDKKLEQDLTSLQRLQAKLEDKSQEINKSNTILYQLNNEITKKQKQIESQETTISGYESTVGQQKTIIYLATSSLAMLLITIIFVYRGFIDKKKTAQKLAKKEAEIRLLFDIAPLPVVLTDLKSGKAIYINQLGQNLFKIKSANTLKHISWKDFYVDDSKRDEIIAQIRKNKRVDNFEVLLQDVDKNQFYGSVSGLITQYEGNDVIFVAIKDISDIKKAVEDLNNYKTHLEELVKERSQKLVESQTRFKDMAELLPETIFEMNLNGDISFINNSGIEMFGLNETLLKKGVNIFSLTNDQGEMRSLVQTLMSGEKLQSTEFEFKKNQGTNFPAIVYMNYHTKDKKTQLIRGIIVNITERKILERRILNTMIETEEKERKRFAEDLHDGLGSLLSSLNLYVDMLDEPALSTKKKDKLFTTLRDIIHESIKTSKEISNNLRPSTLTRFGLAGSLQSFCDKINDTKKVLINLDQSGLTTKLSANTENALYRIVNELINNTLKYANAKNVWIQLENSNESIQLNYKDDGVGFDKNKALNSNGMGLKNIYTRVNSINGTCKIKSTMGEGTHVFIKVETDNT